ncbi:MAG TPA: methionyl-tRNA formyltransferase [Rubrobacteraceae bacterium]|nr:methionyl-tRNA formyltransferase [Rubrobacteraceae bacterium]
MRVAFAGTPEFAATILRTLAASGHDVRLVVSQPNTRRGRGRKVRPTPVARLALDLELPLRQPARISEVAGEISAQEALVVAAYGQILRPDTLYAAREGAWNVHASLLPKYRGAAPIERAIMAGERETGVTIIRMDEGLDTGPMASQRSVEIPPDMTGGELARLLAEVGAKAIVEVLRQIESGEVNLTEQNSLHATYAPKLSDEDLEIQWEAGAGEVANLVRALSPYLGARTFHSGVDGPVKIWRARVAREADSSLEPGVIRTENDRLFVGCGVGVLEVLELQMPGGRRLPAQDYLRGNALEGAFYW